MLELHIESTWF